MMESARKLLSKEKLYLLSAIYVIVSLIAFGIINYFTWGPGVVTEVSVLTLLLWGSLYLPLIVLNKVADWKVSEFGFVLNRRTGIVIGFSIVLGMWLYVREPEMWMFEKWHYSLIEAFARVGEELYFRGFIYLLVLRLFQTQERPNLWAILLSSIAFAAMHTQSFLPENGTSMVSTFLVALLLAYLRDKTNSLLPGITVHCLLKGRLLGILFGWAIYAVFLLWAFVEKVATERTTVRPNPGCS